VSTATHTQSGGEGLRPGANPENIIEVRDLRKLFPLTRGIVFKKTIAHVTAASRHWAGC
jgi:hypothetical protein